MRTIVSLVAAVLAVAAMLGFAIGIGLISDAAGSDRHVGFGVAFTAGAIPLLIGTVAIAGLGIIIAINQSSVDRDEAMDRLVRRTQKPDA